MKKMKHKLILEIPKKELENYLKIAAENHNLDDRQNGEGDQQNNGYRFVLDLPNENLEIKGDGEIYGYGDFRFSNSEEPMYYSITIQPDAVDVVKMAEIVSKRMNKAKNLFETLSD